MPKALKIIIFDGSFKTTPFIQRLAKGLVANGHRVIIIGFNEHNPNPINKVTYQSLGSNTSYLKLIASSLQLAIGSKKIRAIANALRLIMKGKRKNLQEQNLSLALKKLNPDVVHLQWSSLLSWMEPYLPNHYFKVVLSQRGFLTNVRPFVDSANFQYLQKWYPKLDGLHSVSWAISQVGKKIGIPLTQIDQVVYTGFSLDKLDYNPMLPKREKPLKLLSVGRPHWIKDYPTALKTCAMLKDEDIEFQYTIIGTVSNEELLFLINELGLQAEICITAKLSQEQVYKKMKQADALLLTSIEEGLPNVAVEAMALGLPVISTNCGGMEELITHSKEGWIVPTGDPESLVNAIKNLMALTVSDLNDITLAARKKVERQHAVDKMVNDMELLYQKTLQSE